MQIAYLVLAGGLMLCWLALSVFGPRKLETPNAQAVLRYGVAIRCAALALALAPPLIMIYAIWWFPWPTPAKMHFAGGLLCLASVVAGLFLIEATRVQIAVADDGLTRSSPWSGVITVHWRDVTRVGYSTLNGWFLVEGNGRTIRVSRHLEGIATFTTAVRKNVAGERWASASKALQAIGATHR